MLNKYLKNYGYKEEKIRKILTDYELKSYQENTLIRRIMETNTYLENLISKKDVILITTTCPKIYGYDLKTLNIKYNNFLNLGYSSEELNKMIIKFPNIICYNYEKILSKIKLLLNLGFSLEQVIKMTYKLPQLYCYKNEFIKVLL